MNYLKDYILEKLHLNKDTKKSTEKVLIIPYGKTFSYINDHYKEYDNYSDEHGQTCWMVNLNDIQDIENDIKKNVEKVDWRLFMVPNELLANKVFSHPGRNGRTGWIIDDDIFDQMIEYETRKL